MPKQVLFLCVENSARSLMAEAIFNAANPVGWVAVSAGTRPSMWANPRTATMLGELGLELPAHRPQAATPSMIEGAALRISMGCLDDPSCPARLKSLPIRDWKIPNPVDLDDAGFRKVRDLVAVQVNSLLTELGLADVAPTAPPGR